MTEDEAKQKLCPMARNEVLDSNDNFHALTNRGAKCIGSACMMWRKEKLEYTEEPIPEADFRSPPGYCGLAGKP
jgi:hypothetical protein